MTRRHIVQPMMSYRSPDGRMRHALSGEDVDVADDYLERFDKVNDPDGVLTPPKPKGPAAQKPTPTSRRSTKKAAAKAAGRQPTPRK